MKTTGLNFIEAVKAAMERKKVRRAKWQDKNTDGSPSCLVVYGIYLRFLDGQDFFPSIETILAEDWEIVEDPPKTMGFMEAWEQAKLGKKIARLAWDSVDVAVFDEEENCLVHHFVHHNTPVPVQLRIRKLHIDATDWVVVED